MKVRSKLNISYMGYHIIVGHSMEVIILGKLRILNHSDIVRYLTLITTNGMIAMILESVRSETLINKAHRPMFSSMLRHHREYQKIQISIMIIHIICCKIVLRSYGKTLLQDHNISYDERKSLDRSI